MTCYEQLSDQKLLHSNDPDGAAFRTFYRRHVRQLLAHMARAGLDAPTAADVVADTFLTALLRRSSYDPARGTARAWLVGIMSHKAADQRRQAWRSRRLQKRLEFETPTLTKCDAAAYETLRANDELDGRLSSAVASLSPTLRLPIEARVLRDEPYAAIASALNISEATARQRVRRGLTALRRSLSP